MVEEVLPSLELLVVLILLGAAAAVVIPSFTGGFGGIQLDTAARDLVTRMKQARGAAVSRQRVHRIFLLSPEEPDEPFAYVLTDEYEQPIKRYVAAQGEYLISRNCPNLLPSASIQMGGVPGAEWV